MIKAFEVLTYIGFVLGTILMIGVFAEASGAPQEAAGAAMAAACVVLPYCILAMLQRQELIRLAKS